jgi:hypothetical protein
MERGNRSGENPVQGTEGRKKLIARNRVGNNNGSVSYVYLLDRE